MVRPDFVKRKIYLITEDLARLTHFKDEPFEAIVGDFAKLATVERLLERIVMRAIDVNEHLIAEMADGQEEKTTRLTYRDTFLKLSGLGVYPKDFAGQIAKSAGLRNILIHDYNDVERRIVYASIKECLRDYQRYIESLLAFLNRLP